MPMYNFVKVKIEIALRHGCFLVNLLHIFGRLFPKNTSKRLLLNHKDSTKIYIKI